MPSRTHRFFLFSFTILKKKARCYTLSYPNKQFFGYFSDSVTAKIPDSACASVRASSRRHWVQLILFVVVPV